MTSINVNKYIILYGWNKIIIRYSCLVLHVYDKSDSGESKLFNRVWLYTFSFAVLLIGLYLDWICVIIELHTIYRIHVYVCPYCHLILVFIYHSNRDITSNCNIYSKFLTSNSVRTPIVASESTVCSNITYTASCTCILNDNF